MPTCIATLALPDGTGAPRMAAYFCRALVEAGHSVVLICGDVPRATQNAGRTLLEDMQKAGVRVHVLPELRRLMRPGTVAAVSKIVTQQQGNCIISFQQRDQATAMWAARGTGVPCIVSAQNQYTFWGPWIVRILKEKVFAASTKWFTAQAICTSPLVQSELVDRFGLEASRTTVLPNGIDVYGFPEYSEEQRREARSSLGVDEHDFLMVNVGRIDVQKGQDILLEAFSCVNSGRRLRLAFVGGVSAGGNQQRMQAFHTALRQRVADLRLTDRVLFAGWRDDVPRLLSAADCYVHSARWEGWPLVLMEAMAARLPVIGTDCAGHPQGFENGQHGFIVPAGQVEPLATAIDAISRMKEKQLEQMGARARQLAEQNYDIRIISRRFVAAVEQTLNTDR